MSSSTVFNLIGLSAMFIGKNKMTLDTQYKLFQFHDRIRQVLEKNHKTSVIGMYVEEAVRMYIDCGWSSVEVIETDVPGMVTAEYQPSRMRLFVKDNKVIRAVAG